MAKKIYNEPVRNNGRNKDKFQWYGEVRKTYKGRTYKQKRYFTTKKECMSWIREELQLFDKYHMFSKKLEEERDKDIPTLAEMYAEVVALKEGVLEQSTLQIYNTGYNAISEEIKNKKINMITPMELEMDFKDKSYNTQKMYRIVMKMITEQAQFEGYITDDLTVRLKINSKKKSKQRQKSNEKYLSMKVFDKIISWLNDAVINDTDRETMKSLWYLSRLAGLRCGECLGLKWEDIDFENNILHITRQCDILGSSKQNVVFKNPKYNSIRDVPLSYQLKSYLLPLKESSASDNVCIFINRSKISILNKKIYNEIGEKYLHLHMGRHSFGSDLYANEVPLTAIQRIMGHRDLKTTISIYVHATDEEEEDRKINSVLNQLYSSD